ncbi:MAG: hypothetical protein QOG67_3372, partial [Verrucomicrobiota bacterium]
MPGDSSNRELFDTLCEIATGVELRSWINHLEERSDSLDVQKLFERIGV